MENENQLLVKYNKLPKWLRWILFLPVSFIFSVTISLIMEISARNAGAYEFVLNIIYPAIVQSLFLYFIFFTVPQGKLKWVKMFIIIRTFFLIFFIMQPVLNYWGANMPYDAIFFKELFGEIITLIVSIFLFKNLKNNK